MYIVAASESDEGLVSSGKKRKYIGRGVLVKDQYISVFSFEGFSKKQRKLEKDLDFVKEKHPILFMMPKRGDRKVKSDAVEDLRLWSEANDARENVFFN